MPRRTSLFVLALLVAACGSDGTQNSSPTTLSGPAATTTSASGGESTTTTASTAPVVGKIIYEGGEVELTTVRGSRTCEFDPNADPTGWAIGTRLEGSNDDGRFTATFYISGPETTTNTSASIMGGVLGFGLSANWPTTGSTSESNRDGSYEITDGVVYVELTNRDGLTARMEIDCPLPG